MRLQMGKIKQARKLTETNRAISLRIMNNIIWCGLPLYQLEEILIEVCNQDSKFVGWLKKNGWKDVCNPAKNRQGKSLASPYSKGDYSRFPWFDNKGKLMIKTATLDEIERRINYAKNEPSV